MCPTAVVDDIDAKLRTQPFRHVDIAPIAKGEGAVILLNMTEVVVFEVQDDAGIQILSPITQGEIVLLSNLRTLPYILPLTYIVILCEGSQLLFHVVFGHITHGVSH